MMTGISTHVLDLSRGEPAAGIAVWLQRKTVTWTGLADGVTDSDGRCRDLLGATPLEAGDYRLIFDTGAYFGTQGVDTLYPEVVLAFRVRDASQHHHIPLLLAASGYTTYRGT